MKQRKAALYCRTATGNTRELIRQQYLLQQYAVSKGFFVVSSFLDESAGKMDIDNPVHYQVLCAARQKQFNLLLVERFNIFPAYIEKQIPPIELYSVMESSALKIGNSSNPIFEAAADPPGKAVVYYRNYFENVEK